jgi:glycosyltransferase involved in cell wall biosynthesis
MNPPPLVSVIVPVRDRRALLRELLAALDAQTFRDFETVVVDDGSADGSGALAESWPAAGRPVVVVPAGGVGAVAARRRGVERSQGRILAFTDSDCVPRPGWIEAGVRAMEAGADMVNGLTVAARPPGPLERTVQSGTEGLYPTCNMFFRRTAFDEFGGFDEQVGQRFGFRAGRRAGGLGFGEDTVLAWRMRRAGRPSAYAEGAVVEHHVFAPDLLDTLSRSWQAAAFPALVREVPELRTTLLRRRFLLGSAQLPLYAVVALVLAGRRRSAAAAAMAWVARRAGQVAARPPGPGPAPGAPTALAAVLGRDVVTAVALICGSVRARSLVL